MSLRTAGLGLCLGAAMAGAAGGCQKGGGPAPAPGRPVVPVSHYWFEPPGQVSQIYVVNQGPVYSGAGIVAHNNVYVPTLARPAPTYRVGK